MTDATLRSGLEELARQALGERFCLQTLHPISGGDINTCLRAGSGSEAVFVKLRPAADLAQFSSEADNLRALAACRALRVPAVLGLTQLGEHAVLMLEWLDLHPLHEAAEAERAGSALAELHRIQHHSYGWPQNNFIGSNPQPNTWSDNWPRFFAVQRLQAQLARAAAQGFGGALQTHGAHLCEQLAALFLEYRPPPSLLHGDLWSGNLGALADGTPVVFDPACYFGDREADLAMSELFGGLPLRFYAAYREASPLAPGYETRKTLYNLYHVLNHLNLFGRSYLGQAERMSAALCASLRS